jgi:hypothetical protein
MARGFLLRFQLFALALAFALVACGGSARAVATQRGHATPTGSSIVAIRTQYQWASSEMNTYANSFRIELTDAERSNSGETLFGACQGFAGELEGFDVEVSAIAFPSDLIRKLNDVVSVDKVLENDLHSFWPNSLHAWLTQWQSDVVKAQTAHDALTQALHLSDDTFLAII